MSATQSIIIAITTIPATEVVAEVVQSGLLEARLQLGLEHIFVSDYAIACRPDLELPLLRLANRHSHFTIAQFTERDHRFREIFRDHHQILEPGLEYMSVGWSLQNAYCEHYGCGERWEPEPEGMPMYRNRIGPIPDVGMLIMHELAVPVDAWLDLDAERMAGIRAANWLRNHGEMARSAELLGPVIDRKGLLS